MNLAVALLKSGEYIIAQFSEMEYEPRVHMFRPYIISGSAKLSFSQFPKYTEEEHILVHSDSVLTMVEPTEALAEAYAKKLGTTLETLKTPPKRVILNEEDNPHPILDGTDDEYEPRYTEDPIY